MIKTKSTSDLARMGETTIKAQQGTKLRNRTLILVFRPALRFVPTRALFVAASSGLFDVPPSHGLGFGDPAPVPDVESLPIHRPRLREQIR